MEGRRGTKGREMKWGRKQDGKLQELLERGGWLPTDALSVGGGTEIKRKGLCTRSRSHSTTGDVRQVRSRI